MSWEGVALGVLSKLSLELGSVVELGLAFPHSLVSLNFWMIQCPH